MRATLRPLLVLAVTLAACAGTTLQTADTWAQRVCRLVLAMPVASASALPEGVTINVTVFPSVAVAVQSVNAPDAGAEAAPPTAIASAIPLPRAVDASSE